MWPTRERDIALMNHIISGWKREREEAAAVSAAVQRPKKKKGKRSGQKKKKKKRRGVATGEATGAAATTAAAAVETAVETEKATAATTAAAATTAVAEKATATTTAAAATTAATEKTTATTARADEVLQLAQPTPAVTEMSLESEAAPETSWSLSQMLGTTAGTTAASSLSQILGVVKAAPLSRTPPTQVSLSPSPTPVFCPVHSVITYQELIVKESTQEADAVFGTGSEVGLGLFLPTSRPGRPLSTKVVTEDLLLTGPGVQRVRVEDMATWQQPYSMTDLRDEAYVYVPSDKSIQCKLFFAQHSRKPTHTAVQEDGDDVPRFSYNKPMDPGQ